MPLHLTLLNADADAESEEWVEKPFSSAEGFKSTWWTGSAKGPLVWCSLAHPAHGEVARVQIRPQSHVGVAYPSRDVPIGGATEIDLLEVRADLQRSGLGIGTQSLATVLDVFPPPYVALSLDADSDGFWRRVGWREHDHERNAAARAEGAKLAALLFAWPA